MFSRLGKRNHSILAILSLVAVIVYLFYTAPQPLPEAKEGGQTISVEIAFELLETANDAARQIWTQEIVGHGTSVGLKFGEDWQQDDVDAGPLPALFLRETAKHLEALPRPLSLYLGSDHPINSANHFAEEQSQFFEVLKATLKPQFFFDTSTGRHTAMFPDAAIAKPCVTCHNEHPQSPKKDWQLHDVMGATTWAYPKGNVPVSEVLELLNSLRKATRQTYEGYVSKARSFATPPSIGACWPREKRFCLPSPDVFMRAVEQEFSPSILTRLAESASAAGTDETSI